MAKPKKRMLGLYLPETTIERLQKLAEKDYRTANAYVALLVEKHLESVTDEPKTTDQ